MEQKTIALFGGSFNPPALHHRDIAKKLAKEFDEVKVIPCGPRPDKETTNDIDEIHRAVMADLDFSNIAESISVELFDLENGTFTRNHELEEIYKKEGKLWHVVGADLVKGGGSGESFIQTTWAKGRELWNSLNFAVVLREGFDLAPEDFPPNHMVIEPEFSGSSTDARNTAFHRKPLGELVSPEVEAYIERHNLYRGRRGVKNTTFKIEHPRPFVIADENNKQAQEVKKMLRPLTEHKEPPNVIVVVGGDGFMLNTIRHNWRKRLPFFGINTGHLGFLLNNIDDIDPAKLFDQELILRFSPLLYVEAQDAEGNTRKEVAFNDALVQAHPGRAGWFEISIDGEVRIKKMVADGALAATAAGSTAHARAMGANPVPVGSDIMVVIGSNVSYPDWRGGANVPLDSRITFRNADNTGWRKVIGFADGVTLGEITEMNIRMSRIAAAELLFVPHHDIGEKLSRVQFPG